jgi:EmrB/QacA subfamily drug resistance transporter
MAALMVSLFVAAMDYTVVGTALPTIARELGTFELYPWVVAGYLITSTTTVPLWGRLADIRGRKPVLLAGLAIFVIASALCAWSPSMLWLIGFRTLQGIGAGCIQPLVFTMVGDIFPLAQRARLQGFFSSMWAIAAIVGPALGALFVSTIGWRWIFTINIPIGIAAAALLWGHTERQDQRVKARLDVRGGLLLTIAVTLLLIGLGTGSQSATPNWPIVGIALILLGAFVALESRSRNPTVPLYLMKHRVIGPAILIGLIAGTLMFGVTAYLPLWVQSVQGGSAYEAGVAVAAMSFGWPIASSVSGFAMVRFGYQRLVVIGSLALLAGTVMLAVAQPSSSLSWTGGASLIIGLGMGTFAAPLLIVIQSNVDWAQRGAATALNQFSRTIGGAIGVALMGIVVQRYLASASAPLEARKELSRGLHEDFVALVILAAAVLVAGIAVLFASRRQHLEARVSEAASAGS